MASVFIFFGLCGFCPVFSLLIIYLIYLFHFIKYLPSNLIFLNVSITAFFLITSSRDIRNIIWNVDDDVDDEELFLWYGWPMKGV